MSSIIDSEHGFVGFICTKCNYRCTRRNDLQKHFATQKHARMAQRGLIMEQPRIVPITSIKKNNIDSTHQCICGKSYRHLSSLCKHRRKCDYFHSHMSLTTTNASTDPEPITEVKDEVVLEEKEENILDKEEVNEIGDIEIEEAEEVKETGDTEIEEAEEVKETGDTEIEEGEEVKEIGETKKELEPHMFNSETNAFLIELINEQKKRNDELKDMIERQGKQLEIVASKVDTPSVTNVTTINNTNKFNLNFFLNSECKNAMNVMDFVETIKVTPADLDHLANVGYVEGVTRIMIDGLCKLDVNQRPIHCTDVKRESFYIKDNDVWEKDTSHGDKMHEVVKQVANRNVVAIPDWKKENPLHTDYSTDVHEKYLRIVNAAFGGKNEHDNEMLRNKIIRKAAPKLAPPKKTLQFKI